MGAGRASQTDGASRYQAAKSFHFGGVPGALVTPPKHPQISRSSVPSAHTRQMGHGVAEQQYPLPDTLPPNDLEPSPGSQATVGAKPPDTSTHHVPPPLSLPRSPCSPATGATGLSEQSTQEPDPQGSGPCPPHPCPPGTLARARTRQRGLLFISLSAPSCPSHLHR